MAFGKGNLSGSEFQGVPIPYVIGTQQANLLVSHSGKGTLKTVMVDNGAYSISIDGVHFQEILTGLVNTNIALDIPFTTGYEIYAVTAFKDLIAISEDNERKPSIKTANLGTSSVQSSIVSDIGYGVIKSFDTGKNPTLIVDGVTIFSSTKSGILSPYIYYLESFDFQADVSTEVFNYNKIS